MRTFLVGVVLVALAARDARAVVTGAIFGPGSESFPIAVVPPKDLGGDPGGALGARFAKALTRDLDLSGYFRLVDPKTFVESETSGITAGEIDFVGWSAIGAQALVKGGISASGSGIALEVRLFDVPGRRDVPQASKRFSGGRDDVPRMAHRMADAILEFLTSERGPFDSKIAMVSTRSGRLKDVYTWTFDQDDPVRVTDERSLVIAPRWRPDARALVFASYREHFPRLFQVDVGSRQTARLVPGPGVVLDGAWSPDGTRLLVTREEGGNSDIYLLDRSGQVVQRLTDHWAIDVSPAWAPDGRRFAFCSARTGSPQIYVMNVDGSEVVRVSHTGSYNTSPAWSPKGDHIAYTTRGGGGFQVVVTTPDGGNAQTISSAGSNEDPSWAPDGRYLVFSSTRAGGHHLFLADRDGRTQKQLTRGAGDDTSPAWSARLE
ncbi:MAG: Tol-Pal system beta propeller repeat protein TolB [Deltaproteobacteria bacterium]|nr:MAG: Tol-Pal system beta propeller repeat protein TolB [Deltaproteobacteria bacterium]